MTAIWIMLIALTLLWAATRWGCKHLESKAADLEQRIDKLECDASETESWIQHTIQPQIEELKRKVTE